MIVLQERNLFKCTDYTKTQKKSIRNVKSQGLLCFSAVGQSFNPGHNFIGNDNMDLVVLLSAPKVSSLDWRCERPEAAMNMQTESRWCEREHKSRYR